MISPHHLLRRLHAGAVFCLMGLVATSAFGETQPDAAPRTPAAMASAIRACIDQSDIEALSRLVDWDGASEFKHSVVRFEFRKAFGRKIQSVTAEPVPAEALKSLAAFSSFKANLDIAGEVRVVFADEGSDHDHGPDLVFLIGQQGETMRIALVNPLVPTRHQ